jgi:2-polyprenyl-6-methoxyphenol hydroxylase-like FAD-dependent oxidoreductase
MGAMQADVIVVGAGPTGLLLAGDLAAAGVRTVLLERRDTDSNLSRAFAVHARTLEMLDARGLADELVVTGQRVQRLRVFRRAWLDLKGLPSRFPFVLVTPQYRTEAVLERRARESGVTMVAGANVTGLVQDAETVRVQTAGGHDVSASYVVGADGVRSTVRHSLGQPFPGKSVLRSVMLADVKLQTSPGEVLTVNATGGRFAFLAPFGDGWYRVIAWNRDHQVPDTEPVDFEELRDVTRTALGTDFGMHDPRWMSRFHNDERQVPRYRVGRTFLAGDAAHVHSPAGGQGMNIGLQDAANLSWKLAQAVRGNDSLLDTYHDERYPVGQFVLRLSGGLLRAGVTAPPALRLARSALVAVALRIPVVTRKAGLAVSGIATAYTTGRDRHPLAGTRVPDVRLINGPPRRLYEALRSGGFVLLATPPASDVEAMARQAGVAVAVPSRPGPAPIVLVRPDGYVAWASQTADAAQLGEALRRWCGPSVAGS